MVFYAGDRLTGASSVGCVDDGNTPCISSVSGTVSAGNTLTVTGINLHKRNTTGWDAFFTANSNRWSFEGASFTSDGYDTGALTTGSGGSGSRAYSSAKALFGSQSMLSNLTRTAGSYTCSAQNQEAFIKVASSKRGTGGSDVTFWGRIYGYWESNGANWSDYVKWLYFKDFDTNRDPILIQPKNGADVVPTQWVIHTFDNSTADTFVGSGVTAFATGKWHCVEWKATFSSTLASQVVEVYINDSQVLSMTSGWTLDMRMDELQFGIVNTCNGSGNYDINCYNDGLAIGSQRIYPGCVAEITTSPTYGAGTYCFPLAISDTQSQIVVPALAGGPPYYLHWRNNSQYQSANGYAL